MTSGVAHNIPTATLLAILGGAECHSCGHPQHRWLLHALPRGIHQHHRVPPRGKTHRDLTSGLCWLSRGQFSHGTIVRTGGASRLRQCLHAMPTILAGSKTLRNRLGRLGTELGSPRVLVPRLRQAGARNPPANNYISNIPVHTSQPWLDSPASRLPTAVLTYSLRRYQICTQGGGGGAGV